MATVTKTIGTTGRDYSTITLWEADLDDTGIYSSGDDAVGELYNDSAFDESPTINGGGTVGLNSITLTVPVSERHDGTEGTGARIVRTTGTLRIIQVTVAIMIEWLEVDGNGQSIRRPFSVEGSSNTQTIKNVILHGVTSSSNIKTLSGANSSVMNLMNCIVYDSVVTATNASGNVGIDMDPKADASTIQNCTVYGIINNNGSGTAYGVGISEQSGTTRKIENVISMDTGGTSSGTTQDFIDTSYTIATANTNMSSDTSASGTGSLVSKSSANQFVSTTGGSEDLHLITGADAINAGTDLGTTPSGVEIDIDGRDRDAQGDVWDIGAHEFVAAITTKLKDIIGGGIIPFKR